MKDFLAQKSLIKKDTYFDILLNFLDLRFKIVLFSLKAFITVYKKFTKSNVIHMPPVVLRSLAVSVVFKKKKNNRKEKKFS